MIGTEAYSFEEKNNMWEVYKMVKQDTNRAVREYAHFFPNDRQPHKSIFALLKYNLMTYGQFDRPKEAYYVSEHESYRSY